MIVDSAAPDMTPKKDPTKNLTSLGALRKLAELTDDPVHWAAYEKPVRDAIEESDGNATQAAELLGISLRTLQRILADPRFEDLARNKRGRSPGEMTFEQLSENARRGWKTRRKARGG